MSKVAKSFICSGCLNPVTSAGCTSVDIGASAKLELVDKFCYLGDMLSVDGDADAAVEARIRIGWNMFSVVPLLTNKDVSLIMRGRLYSSCVRSSMLHESETWGPIYKISYDNLTIMPKLRSTYDRCLIYKTSYNEWKAFHR